MPSFVRHLPGNGNKLVDEKMVPKNHVMYNPSVAYPIIYIRKTEHFQTKEENSVVLHNLETKQTHNIPSPWHIMKSNVNLYRGLEDLRICWHNGLLWFSATSTHASDNITSELLVGHFDKALTKVERMSHVDIGSFPVKNVCPFVVGGVLRLFDIYKKAIYELVDHEDPGSGVGTGEGTGEGTGFGIVPTKTLRLTPGLGVSIDGYRGSTSPVHLHGSTWGVIVHDIIFNDQRALVTRLSYLHYWMEFDVATGLVTFVSTPFWVAQWGIEYVSGIHIEQNKKDVMLYLGVNDTLPFQYKTTLHDMRCGK